jgi:hypothetical protein
MKRTRGFCLGKWEGFQKVKRMGEEGESVLHFKRRVSSARGVETDGFLCGKPGRRTRVN